MAAALGPHRLTDARITGGFAFGPRLESASALPTTSYANLLAAAAGASSETHAAAVAHLVLGHVDEALDAMRAAAANGQPDAMLLNDLAAAYLERHRQHGDLRDAVKSLDAVERSLRLAPQLPEALYNRALALASVSLDDRARTAWSEYLKADGRSDWSDEAARRRDALSREAAWTVWQREKAALLAALQDPAARSWEGLADSNRAAAREWLEDDVLASWADAFLAHRTPDAAAALKGAASLAAWLHRREGDRLALDAVTAIEGATPRTRAGLARGHTEYRRARQAYTAQDFEMARPAFENAERAFQAGGSPLAAWARFHLAVIAYQSGRPQEAIVRLLPLEALARRHDYRGLAGRVCWVRGLIALLGASFQDALARYREALEFFDRTGEREHAAFVHLVLSDAFRTLGEDRSAWMHLGLALADRNLVRRPTGRQSMLLNAAVMSQRLQAPFAGLGFQLAAFEIARAEGTAAQRVDALLRLANAHRQTGDRAQALAEAASASTAAQRVPAGAVHDRLAAELSVVRAQLGMEPVQELSSAIAFFERQKARSRLPALLLERARAQRTAALDAAVADLDAGIAIVDADLRQLEQPARRIDYLDSQWDLYADLVRLEAQRQNRPGAALYRLEAARAASGLPHGRSGIETTTRRIAPGIAVVVYLVGDDGVLIWSMTSGGLSFTFREIARSQLDALVADHSRVLTATQARTVGRSRDRLYDTLIGTLPEDVKEAQTLVIVPDGVLHRVSFAALQNNETGQFLIERQTVVAAPSVALFLKASERPAESAEPTALIVDASRPARSELDDDLPHLPWASAEARAIAATYPRSQVLDGSTATKQRFLSELPRRSVLHFAGHAVASLERPELSRLVFSTAEKPGQSAVLFATELDGHSAAETRLVVLAACRTAGGALSRSQGVLSLARPFLSAGVPSVVASLVDVSDRDTSTLLTRFHAIYWERRDAPLALREAQLQMIRSADPAERLPRAWATFVPIGGVATAEPPRGS